MNWKNTLRKEIVNYTSYEELIEGIETRLSNNKYAPMLITALNEIKDSGEEFKMKDTYFKALSKIKNRMMQGYGQAEEKREIGRALGLSGF